MFFCYSLDYIFFPISEEKSEGQRNGIASCEIEQMNPMVTLSRTRSHPFKHVSGLLK